jgi:excisionase family DNA binding protein
MPKPQHRRGAGKTGEENMMNVEIRFVMQGKEVSIDSFVEAIVREVRTSVREEISRTLPKHEQQGSDSPRRVNSEMPPQAVSVREAAHLLSISQRTVDKYVALKVIRTVRVGRRVLVPMKSVYEVVARGIPSRRNQKSITKPGPSFSS